MSHLRGSRSAAGWCVGAQQAMEGERDTAHQPCHGSAVAPLLGFRRELLVSDGWWGWLVTGKVLLDVAYFDRNIARNKVQLERNKVFKIKYGCKRIIDYS